MEIRAVRGMHDLFGQEIEQWTILENRVRSVFKGFGYSELRTPVLEKIEVFSQTVGEQTEIVEKQMYSLMAGSDKLVLRPEGTASFIRAIIEHQLHLDGKNRRFFYYLPMFRHERPQKGRLRQFHQFGAEFIQDSTPQADVEMLCLVDHLYRSLDLGDFEIHINSVGCVTCRQGYRDLLKAWLRPKLNNLCEECRQRFERSVLRVLDCKNESCHTVVREAPSILSHLCTSCHMHHQSLKQGLGLTGITFIEDPKIVRGLDYYCKTAFEFTSNLLGAQSALAGGGRYDGLSERFGAKSFPAVGFAMGMERLMVALQEKQKLPQVDTSPIYFFVALGTAAYEQLILLGLKMKKRGISVEMVYEKDKSLKTQLKQADRSGAHFALILGDAELNRSEVILKNMRDGIQETIQMDQLESQLIGRAQSAL